MTVEALEDGALRIPVPAAQRAPQGRRRTGQPAEPAHDPADRADRAVGNGAAVMDARQLADAQHDRAPDRQEGADDRLEDGLIDMGQQGGAERHAENAAEDEGQRRTSKLPRSEPTVSTWPISEPKTTIGAASCGAIAQTQKAIAVSPKAKPDSPWMKPAAQAPRMT